MHLLEIVELVEKNEWLSNNGRRIVGMMFNDWGEVEGSYLWTTRERFAGDS